MKYLQYRHFYLPGQCRFPAPFSTGLRRHHRQAAAACATADCSSAVAMIVTTTTAHGRRRGRRSRCLFLRCVPGVNLSVCLAAALHLLPGLPQGLQQQVLSPAVSQDGQAASDSESGSIYLVLLPCRARKPGVGAKIRYDSTLCTVQLSGAYASFFSSNMVNRHCQQPLARTAHITNFVKHSTYPHLLEHSRATAYGRRAFTCSRFHRHHPATSWAIRHSTSPSSRAAGAGALPLRRHSFSLFFSVAAAIAVVVPGMMTFPSGVDCVGVFSSPSSIFWTCRGSTRHGAELEPGCVSAAQSMYGVGS